MENRGGADDVAKDSARAGGIQESDFAEEFSSDLPSTAMPSSATSGSSPYASLSSPSAAKADDRDVAHGAGRVDDTKKLEHALPADPRMQLPAAGFGMVDSMGRPPVVYASNSDVGPGAFPVRSSRNTATGRTVRSPIGSYNYPREFTNEESKQEDGVPNSAAAGIGLYAVEAQRVPDGNEDGTVLVAEAQHLTPLKWYQRRWITLGLALCACGFAAAVVVMVVLLVRQPSAATSSSSLTGAPTTPEPTTAPEAIACNFISIPDVTECRSTLVFNSDTTTGSTIPSEIGLLTQLTGLHFYSNQLTSSIPSEIGLLTQLTFLGISNNSLSSTIPSEIGLLTKLTFLHFYDNSLTSTIPSEIGLLTQLTALFFHTNSLTSTIPSTIGLLTLLEGLFFYNNELTGTIPSSLCSLPSPPSIVIDCGEIACASGCCSDWDGVTESSCG